MTAIAAVAAADPAGEARVRRMLDAAPHRGGAHESIWSCTAAALGCRTRRVDPAHGGEPLARAPDGSAIVFDGRLDNRDELRRAWSLPSDASDAAIALAAYRAAGPAGVARLLGDFAFALWDAPRRQIVGARDAFGQRPLFYGSASGIVVLASEPQQVRAHDTMPAAINEAFVAELLSGRPTTVADTVWLAVRRVPPAHIITAQGDVVRVARYWDLNPSAPAPNRRDDDYAEEFRALFREAVDCRTRDGAAGIFLSGGLDSSSIAAVAEQLARERGGPPLQSFSLSFPGLPPDETRFIDAVVKHWQLRAHCLPAEAPARSGIEAEIDRYQDLPQYPNGMMVDPLRRYAAANVDVVLTGYGGDEWLAGSPSHTADLLREGRVLSAARQIYDDWRLPGRGYTVAALIRTAVAPLLSARMRRLLRPIAGTPRETFPWITAAFARRTALEDRLRPAPSPRFPAEVQSSVHRIVNGLQQIIGDELEDRSAAAAGLTQRHPFNDRRLAEFAFALPERQRWRGGETKVVLRRAMGDALPRIVRDRNDKAEFSSATIDAIEALGGRALFSRLAVAEAGWVEPGVVQQAYDDMRRLYTRGDEAYIHLTGVVWNVAAVELWFTRQGFASTRKRQA